MSRSALSSQADAWEVRKEEKRPKSRKEKSEAEVKPEEQDADSDSKSHKKRKREALPDEIEIDVSLPEPASKKDARRAKKAKSNPKPATGDGDADAKAGTEGEKKEAQRSQYGVWIGNLPWSATKDSLRTFISGNTEITPEQITRVHMPPPTKPPNPNWTMKPLNKGFAYVDFSTELSMYAAIALTETKMDGRPLLIKNAKSFEGRPDKPKGEEAEGDAKGKGGKTGHPPNKRVFVGNLSFDVTKEDLQTHYAQCGEIADLHMATFEDSGKCKGYAWVTFEDVEAATSAVKGFVFKEEIEKKKKSKKDASDSSEEEAKEKKTKKRKWFINKLMGRELRCEFAEDSTTRYNKRYGKEKSADMEGLHPDRVRQLDNDGAPQGGRPKRPFQDKRPRGKVDPRTIKPGAAQMNAQRAPQGIVKSEGKKTTFD